MTDQVNWKVLEQLYSVIEGRKGADPKSSYTANLLSKGTAKIAQKVGEEATEAVIEAMRSDASALTSESADLLYHLMVLWVDQGVKPEDIFEELSKRTGQSGIEEKQSRK